VLCTLAQRTCAKFRDNWRKTVGGVAITRKFDDAQNTDSQSTILQAPLAAKDAQILNLNLKQQSSV